MAHLHCRRRTLVRTRTGIPVLYRNREQGSESESVQCEHVLHSTMQALGLESESESVPDYVSGNVNKPLHSSVCRRILVLSWTHLRWKVFATEMGR